MQHQRPIRALELYAGSRALRNRVANLEHQLDGFADDALDHTYADLTVRSAPR